MIISNYYFLEELNKKHNLYLLEKLSNSDLNFLDIYEDFVESYAEFYYLIDYLPQTMHDNFVYSKFFNIYYDKLFDVNDFTIHSFDYYYKKYMKIICMLIGYNNSPVFFESSLFYNFDEIKNINSELILNAYNTNNKIFNFNDCFNVFMKVFELSLKNNCELLLYLSDLEMIIRINGLLLDCFIFNNLDLIYSITRTEGLYCYQKK